MPDILSYGGGVQTAAKESYRQLVINGATPEVLAAGRKVVYAATKAKIAAQNAPEVY